jgi:hypothetical protein
LEAKSLFTNLILHILRYLTGNKIIGVGTHLSFSRFHKLPCPLKPNSKRPLKTTVIRESLNLVRDPPNINLILPTEATTGETTMTTTIPQKIKPCNLLRARQPLLITEDPPIHPKILIITTTEIIINRRSENIMSAGDTKMIIIVGIIINIIRQVALAEKDHLPLLIVRGIEIAVETSIMTTTVEVARIIIDRVDLHTIITGNMRTLKSITTNIIGHPLIQGHDRGMITVVLLIKKSIKCMDITIIKRKPSISLRNNKIMKIHGSSHNLTNKKRWDQIDLGKIKANGFKELLR